jgi:hypothetical protein
VGDSQAKKKPRILGNIWDRRFLQLLEIATGRNHILEVWFVLQPCGHSWKRAVLSNQYL